MLFLLVVQFCSATLAELNAPNNWVRFVAVPRGDYAHCPFCNLERCGGLGVCYIEKHRLRGALDSEHCATPQELSALLRDQLALWATRDACQPAKTEHDIALCWCARRTNQTEEDALRDVRIWRFQSLILHMRSAAARPPVALVLLSRLL